MSVSAELQRIATLAHLIGPARHVAVGAASPIPAAAAFLARARHGTRVTVLHDRRQNTFTDGARELFDMAGQGRIDVFFLGGVQIDGGANINLVGTGADYPRVAKRFPGSFGAAYLYYVVPRVILYREEHSPRTLVERVDFVSAPGTSPADVFRPGGPTHLLTGKALFAFDRHRGRFTLQAYDAAETPATIDQATGFTFDTDRDAGPWPVPDAMTLALIRTTVVSALARSYPEFAGRVFGVGT